MQKANIDSVWFEIFNKSKIVAYLTSPCNFGGFILFLNLRWVQFETNSYLIIIKLKLYNLIHYQNIKKI